MVEENKSTICTCGAIALLVSLMLSSSNRGKKDALTTLYKVCSVRQNKEKAVKPLVELVTEEGSGMAEKAMVVLNSLAGIKEEKDAIVKEGGIGVLVEAVDKGYVKGKEFALLILIQLCAHSIRNIELVVREGGIPPLIALFQTASVCEKAKQKAQKLL